MHWNEHLLLHDKPQDKGYFLLKFTCIRRTGAGFNYRHKRQFIHQLWLKLYIKATLPVQIKKLKEHFQNSKNFELQCNNTNNTNKEWKEEKKTIANHETEELLPSWEFIFFVFNEVPLKKETRTQPNLKIRQPEFSRSWAGWRSSSGVGCVCPLCNVWHGTSLKRNPLEIKFKLTRRKRKRLMSWHPAPWHYAGLRI